MITRFLSKKSLLERKIQKLEKDKQGFLLMGNNELFIKTSLALNVCRERLMVLDEKNKK